MLEPPILGSTLVLVLLPERKDYDQDRAGGFRQTLAQELQRRGMRYVDVVSDLRRLPAQRVEQLYQSAGDGSVPGLAGHYSEEGTVSSPTCWTRTCAPWI